MLIVIIQRNRVTDKAVLPVNRFLTHGDRGFAKKVLFWIRRKALNDILLNSKLQALAFQELKQRIRRTGKIIFLL
ncbi:hypothetical protein D3C74_283390 [compost metagenome]